MGGPRPRMLALAALMAAALVITTTAVAADYHLTRPPLPISDHEAALVGHFELSKDADANNSAHCPSFAAVSAPLKGWRDLTRRYRGLEKSSLYRAEAVVDAGIFSFDGVACEAPDALFVYWYFSTKSPLRSYSFYLRPWASWQCGYLRLDDISFTGRRRGLHSLRTLGPNWFDCTYIATDSEPKREEVSAVGTGAAPNTTSGGGAENLHPRDGMKGDNSPSPEGTASCFPAAATVELADGSTAALGALPAGSTVRVGARTHSDVFGWSHRQTGGRHAYVRLTHVDGAGAPAAATRDLLLSPGHLVYANGMRVPARDVVVGDALTTPGTATRVSRVVAVGSAVAVGKVNPHTLHGDVVVDGVRVSSYTDALHPTVAHALLAPARAAYRAGLSAEPLGRLLYNGVPGWGGWRA